MGTTFRGSLMATATAQPDLQKEGTVRQSTPSSRVQVHLVPWLELNTMCGASPVEVVVVSSASGYVHKVSGAVGARHLPRTVANSASSGVSKAEYASRSETH